MAILISFPQVSEFQIAIYGLDQSGRLTVEPDGNVPTQWRPSANLHGREGAAQ